MTSSDRQMERDFPEGVIVMPGIKKEAPKGPYLVLLICEEVLGGLHHVLTHPVLSLIDILPRLYTAILTIRICLYHILYI